MVQRGQDALEFQQVNVLLRERGGQRIGSPGLDGDAEIVQDRSEDLHVAAGVYR